MKSRIIAITLMMHLSAFGGKLPADNQFFKEETVVKTYRIPGAHIKMLSTAKDFDTLKEELEKLLGKGWVTEEPKPIKNPRIRKKMETDGLTPETTVIYVTPENPKLRVSLSLTKMKGQAQGQSIALLTITRNFKGR